MVYFLESLRLLRESLHINNIYLPEYYSSFYNINFPTLGTEVFFFKRILLIIDFEKLSQS